MYACSRNAEKDIDGLKIVARAYRQVEFYFLLFYFDQE